MPSIAYSEVLDQAQRLTYADQLRLLEDLAVSLRHSMSAQPQRSILELQGLGKEIWEGIDAQNYVDQERDSWNG